MMTQVRELWARLARLPREQRGVILIPALLMGAVLAGAMAHLADIHTAISYREQAQELADVAAGEGAYWHAQGMNLLALLNILMAVVLSLFVALRLAELIAVAVSIIAAFIPGGGGVAATAARQAEQFYQWERKLSPPLMRTLNWGTKIEEAVAAAFPYVALAASAAKDGGSGFAWSTSLFPTAPDNLLAKKLSYKGVEVTAFPARMGGMIAGDLTNRVLGRFPRAGALAGGLVGSLPVEAEDYFQLCSRASEQVARYAFLDHVPMVEEAMGWLGGNATALMCQPLSEAKNVVEKQIASEAKKGAQAHCEADEKSWRDQELARREQEQRDRSMCERFRDRCKDIVRGITGRPKPPSPAPEWSAAQRKQCRKDKEESLRKDAEKKAEKLRDTDKDSTKDIKTAKLWSLIDADNTTGAPGGGKDVALQSPFLHVWSHHMDEPPSVSVEPGWIRVLPNLRSHMPSVDFRLPRVESIEPNVSSAKAIFYYRCSEAGDAGMRTCGDNALWRLHWRYRFSVDRDAANELKMAIGDSAKGYIGYMTGEFLSGVLGRVLSGLGKNGGAADRWQRDAGSRAVKIDADSIWLRRLTGATLTQNSGKTYTTQWFVPDKVTGAISDSKTLTDILYLR